jgi:hypothetical protein
VRGAILNDGRVEVIDSIFVANRGSRAREREDNENIYHVGGAILNEGADGPSVVTIEGSTFFGNRAMVGGAITNFPGNQVIIRRSTLSGNIAYVPCPTCPVSRPGSPAIHNYGGIVLEDVTITANQCDEFFRECGALVLQSLLSTASASVSNSLVAGNPDGDCTDRGTVSLVSVAMNLDSDGSCPGFGLHAPPRLGPLQDNGGPTPTHALLPISPAVNAGTSCLARDQRGESRARSAENPCDIGAFELR